MAEKLDRRPEVSPFASNAVKVILKDGSVFNVPAFLLDACPRMRDECKPGPLQLVDVKHDVGHVIFYYLLTNTYQCLRPLGISSRARLIDEFKTSVQVYIAARKYDLPGLQILAQKEIQALAKELPFPLVLNMFQELGLDPNGGETWVDEYVQSNLGNIFLRPTAFLEDISFRADNGALSFTNILLKNLAALLAKGSALARRDIVETSKPAGEDAIIPPTSVRQDIVVPSTPGAEDIVSPITLSREDTVAPTSPCLEDTAAPATTTEEDITPPSKSSHEDDIAAPSTPSGKDTVTPSIPSQDDIAAPSVSSPEPVLTEVASTASTIAPIEVTHESKQEPEESIIKEAPEQTQAVSPVPRIATPVNSKPEDAQDSPSPKTTTVNSSPHYVLEAEFESTLKTSTESAPAAAATAENSEAGRNLWDGWSKPKTEESLAFVVVSPPAAAAGDEPCSRPETPKNGSAYPAAAPAPLRGKKKSKKRSLRLLDGGSSPSPPPPPALAVVVAVEPAA